MDRRRGESGAAEPGASSHPARDGRTSVPSERMRVPRSGQAGRDGGGGAPAVVWRGARSIAQRMTDAFEQGSARLRTRDTVRAPPNTGRLGLRAKARSSSCRVPVLARFVVAVSARESARGGPTRDRSAVERRVQGSAASTTGATTRASTSISRARSPHRTVAPEASALLRSARVGVRQRTCSPRRRRARGRTRVAGSTSLKSPQHGPFPPRRDGGCQKLRYRWKRKRSSFFLSAARTALVLPTCFAEQERDREWILCLTACLATPHAVRRSTAAYPYPTGSTGVRSYQRGDSKGLILSPKRRCAKIARSAAPPNVRRGSGCGVREPRTRDRRST